MTARYDTVSTIVADVGAELALGTLTAAYPATGAIVSRMQALLKATGRRLVREYPWLQCLIDYTFTADGSARYAMPDGFLRMEDATGWNRSTRQPLVPMSPQQWEAMQAMAVTSGIPQLFRASRTPGVTGDSGAVTFQFLSSPTTGNTIYLQYRSQYWLSAAVGAVVTKDAPTVDTDIVRIDPHLFTRALKMEWLRAVGMDSAAAQQDYESALDAAQSANIVTAPSLSLNGPRMAADRLLSSVNIPETGFGT